MKFARVLVATCLALGLSVAAQAKTSHLGLLSDGDVVSTMGKVKKGESSFSDTVTFKLASESSIVDFFTALKSITSFTVTLMLNKLELGSFSGGPGGNPSSVTPFTFASLAPNKGNQHYTLLITGNGAGTGKTTYYNALSVSAVPEADTWLMLIAGVGLIGFQLRRKQQSLPQRPFN